jgi:hypothetical protein
MTERDKVRAWLTFVSVYAAVLLIAAAKALAVIE